MSKDDLSPPGDRPILPASWRVIGPDAQTPGAAEVIANAADDVNAFLHRQRQAVGTSPISLHRGQYVSDQLDVFYQNVQGEERITLVPRVPSSVPPPPPEIEAYAVELLEEIEHPGFDPYCMLVLYKGNRIAAFDMAGLDNAVLALLYTGKVKATFTAPVLTCQLDVGTVPVIVTDFDLACKKQQPSIIATTRLVDAISLGRQSALPMFAGTARERELSLFTSVCAVSYRDAKFTLGAARANPDQQPVAIMPTGYAYYGPVVETDQASFVTDRSDVDDATGQKALADADAAVANWVSVYTCNYVNQVDSTQSRSMSSTTETSRQQTNVQGLPKPQYFNYITHPTHNVSSVDTTQTITVVATVVPNDDPTNPPAHQNQSDVTQGLGYSYYGEGNYTDDMKVTAVALAYGFTQYYGYSIDDNLFEYIRPGGAPKELISGVVPRMVASVAPDKSRAVAGQDTIDLVARLTQTVTSQGITRLPSWGGDLYDGHTAMPLQSTPFTKTPDSNDPYNVILDAGISSPLFGDTYSSASDGDHQMVLHTTVDADTVVPEPSSYGDVAGAYGEIRNKLLQPIPGNNGGPGPTRTYSSHTTHTETIDQKTVPQGEMVYGTQPMGTENEPTVISDTGGGGIPDPPGYNAQLLNSRRDYALGWLKEELSASDDGNGGTTAVELILAVFPYGTTTTAFYTRLTQASADADVVRAVVTPYETLTGNDAAGGLKPWLHVADAKHLLQGVLVGDKPRLYLDGTNIIDKLAKALKCDAKDIASCYLDIRLSDIRQMH